MPNLPLTRNRLLALLIGMTSLVLTACAAAPVTPEPADSPGVEENATLPATNAASTLSATAYTFDDAATFVDAEVLAPTLRPLAPAAGSPTSPAARWSGTKSSPADRPRTASPPLTAELRERGRRPAQWLSDRDPVIFFANNGEARAYPLSILMWHEIANDEVGGLPVSVTFCPLCNASIVFDRQLDDEILDFGTTGRLRNSDLIMYDRQTETWWQQFTGEAIVGEHVGRQLNFLPSQVISFGDYAARFPEGSVLARPAAARDYGRNPYTNYDSREPFLFNGEIDDRLRATERVVGLEVDGNVVAYPFSSTVTEGAINDRVGETPIVIFHKPGTASALDGADIATSRDIGSAAVFDRRVGDQTLTFSPNPDGAFSDAETGSTWNILGEAVAGDLAGAQLEASHLLRPLLVCLASLLSGDGAFLDPVGVNADLGVGIWGCRTGLLVPSRIRTPQSKIRIPKSPHRQHVPARSSSFILRAVVPVASRVMR